MKIFKKLLVLLCAAIAAFSAIALIGCNVEARADSEVYSCYYYAVDGEDLTSEIVNYTLELRTDNVLITRYKTKKNSDSGRDDYYIKGDYLVVTTYYGEKEYDIMGNEVIISEYVDGSHVLVKFRLTQTTKEISADIYSCISRTVGEADVTADLRSFVAEFCVEGTFTLWYRDKTKREKFTGTFTKYEQGYTATESAAIAEEGSEPGKEWRFGYQGDVLILEEETDGVVTVSKFIKTQSAGTE